MLDSGWQEGRELKRMRLRKLDRMSEGYKLDCDAFYAIK